MPSNIGYMTTDGIDLNEILYGKILPIIDVYNSEEVLDLRALLCQDWDESFYQFDVSGQWKFEDLGESSIPKAKKIVLGKKQKDTKKRGLRIGYTYDWLVSEMASADQILRLTKKAVGRDRALITATILDAMLQKTVDGFFNGSFDTYEKLTAPPSYGANSFTSSHSHYVATGSSTLSLANITAAKKHIKEHGFKGNIWGFCNADFISKIEDLGGWAAQSQTNFIVPTTVVNNISVEGFRGKLLGINWKETEWMPDDYFLLVGENDSQVIKPVNYIQKKNPAGKGLKLLPGNTAGYPLIDSYYIHFLAAQVILRAAGVVYYLGSSWTDPNVLANVVE